MTLDYELPRREIGKERSLLRRAWLVAATATIAICGAATAQDLDAGKSGAELFTSNCAGCHASPRDLAGARSERSLADILRRHYTSDSGTAGEVAAYLLTAPNDRQTARQSAEPPPKPRPVQTSNRPVDDRAAERARAGANRNPDSHNRWRDCPDHSCFPLYGAYGR
jgi:hypothetical protein